MNVTLEESGEACLDALIPQVEAAVEAVCNRTWDTTSPQTESSDGGVTRLFPRSTPISSVNALTVNDTIVERNHDYYVMPGYIRFAYKLSSIFSKRSVDLHAQSNPARRREAGDDPLGSPALYCFTLTRPRLVGL